MVASSAPAVALGAARRRGQRRPVAAPVQLLPVALAGLVCTRLGSPSRCRPPAALALRAPQGPSAAAGGPAPLVAALKRPGAWTKEAVHVRGVVQDKVGDDMEVQTATATHQLGAGSVLARRFGRAALLVGAVAGATAGLRLATLHLDGLADGFARVLYGPTSLTPVYVVAGAGAGALHTLSGPDHLAALAPLALRVRGGPGSAFRTGALWGSSHVLGQLILGLGLLLLGRCGLCSGLVASMGNNAERLATLAVGAVLILIGGLGLKESREWEEGEEDEHEAHGGPLDWRTLGTGILSGMHPDALLLCLPALALPSRVAGLAYLSAFGVGTLAAMGAYAAALRAACRALGGGAVRTVAVVSSGVAIAVGGAVCCSAFGVPLLAGLV